MFEKPVRPTDEQPEVSALPQISNPLRPGPAAGLQHTLQSLQDDFPQNITATTSSTCFPVPEDVAAEKSFLTRQTRYRWDATPAYSQVYTRSRFSFSRRGPSARTCRLERIKQLPDSEVLHFKFHDVRVWRSRHERPSLRRGGATVRSAWHSDGRRELDSPLSFPSIVIMRKRSAAATGSFVCSRTPWCTSHGCVPLCLCWLRQGNCQRKGTPRDAQAL